MRVVKECEQMFGDVHLPICFNQRIMNGKAELEEHQRISLFATFSLPHGVSPACVVFP